MRRYAQVPGGDDRHRGKTSSSVRAGGQCLLNEYPPFRSQSYALKPQFARIFLPDQSDDFLLMTVANLQQNLAVIRAGKEPSASFPRAPSRPPRAAVSPRLC